MGSRLDILPKVMSCLSARHMSPQTDVVLPCIGGVLAEMLGSRVVLGLPALGTFVILCEGPTFLADMGNGHLPSRAAKPGGGTGRSAMGFAGPGGSFQGCAKGTDASTPGSLRRCSTWWPGSRLGGRRTPDHGSPMLPLRREGPMEYRLFPTPDRLHRQESSH